MTTKDEMPFEEKLAAAGVSIHVTEPINERDTYGGFIDVEGSKENVLKVLKGMAKSGGYYYPEDPKGTNDFRVKRICNEIDRTVPRGTTLDLDVLNTEGKKVMVRIVSDPCRNEDAWHVSLGGGGNHTTLEEMKFAFEKGLDKSLEEI